MADAVSRARYPLAETTNRMNSPFPVIEHQAGKPRYDQSQGAYQAYHGQHTPQTPQSEYRSATTPVRQTASEAQVPNVSSQMQQHADDKRLSQASYASTSSSRSKKNYKTHIGPWQLGKTLGKGSSARVRLCRHNVTGQLAAVKIVNRKMAYLVRDSSLAALSKWDNSLPRQVNGEMRVPMAIEREVAILKLIEHPNIMKLYDIWENRSEVYLILEYIDQGDLFTFINTKGKLTEEVAIFFFRQMISAITYCHSFNVCHRDLKPENILITADLQIKIADFGMAALHQTANHQLATACGSPHYAAPELLKNRQYRGDRADIWSMGVILYAMLSATLPFDDPDLRIMMAKTKKGHYEMPKFLSPEAEDLIRRMLQVNPDHRITLKEIWRHPVVQRYSYLDDFGDNSSQLPDTRKGFQFSPVPRQDIDPQLLRQLRSMWHMFSEHDLAQKLSCEEPNDQKAFYWLLYNYRNKQLEDFKPELTHSMSDYHHLKPGAWKKRVSTCQFAQPRANGHGRSVSRFTVISNTAETEAETVRSYDPYRGSRMLKPHDSHIGQAKITVHRDGETSTATPVTQAARLRSGSNPRRGRANSSKAPFSGRPQSSRGSLASQRSSRQGTPTVQAPSLRHKRGVDFTHIRKRSASTGRLHRGPQRIATTTIVAEGSPNIARSLRGETPDLPRLQDGTYPKAKGAPSATTRRKDASLIFNEELRHFSDNIAKDCDEAFKSSFIEEESNAASSTEGDNKQNQNSPLSLTFDGSAEANRKLWQTRPLPPIPSEDAQGSRPTTSASSRPTSSGDDDSVTLGEQISRLAIPVLLPKQIDRRAVSAPTYGQSNRKTSALPSIQENGCVTSTAGEKARIVSAPPYSSARRGNELNNSMEYLSTVENTIRVVDSPKSSPVEVPEPLNIQKNTVTEEFARLLQKQLAYNAVAFGKNERVNLSQQEAQKKRPSWFKRSSRTGTDSEASGQNSVAHSTSEDAIQKPETLSTDGPRKKKALNFPFWKTPRGRDLKMSIEADSEQADGQGHAVNNIQGKKKQHGSLQDSSSGGTRNIEGKQNWLTRLFRVKPATSYICMTLSRKRARQEVAIILREWRRYGVKGIQVDKQRNIIFARIGATNYLNLKEVEFAAEIMTVIEHGRKQPLSIVRFTQERGAASSFYRVVDTMRIVFNSRHLIVSDRSKQKMMIKTLNS